MFEQIDLNKKITKKEFKEILPDLEIKLGMLQRQARNLKIPVIIVFEGWDAAGKGSLINRLLLPLDSRGVSVFTLTPPTTDELLKPYLWRFWTKIPQAGRIAIFDRSWYQRVSHHRVEKIAKKQEWRKAYQEIKAFERQLTDDDNIIIKFFLHISKKEQKRRFNKLLENSHTAWRVSREDKKQHNKYKLYTKVYEQMIARTDTEYAPWTIVEAENERFAIIKVLSRVSETLRQRIDQIKKSRTRKKSGKKSKLVLSNINSSILAKVDFSVSLTKPIYEIKLDEYQKKIRELEHRIYVKRIPVIILYEGCDAAGKGGNIRRLVREMDPRGYEVVPISAPNDIELAHHYLWRFWNKIPKAGHITIFDRSWYGRVLVERVEGFCSKEQWQRAYREINETEAQFIDFGIVLIKFWLEISKDEQLKRFKERENTPHKRWKITKDDWRNRKNWNEYRLATDEMLFRTSTSNAPWTIVESNSKYYARIKVLETVIKSIEKHL